MKIDHYRIDDDAESTTGYYKIDGKFECFVLEDQKQLVKVPKETRIPAGTYKLGLRKVDSPKTQSYREKYDWFTWHIQILDVPDFQYVYIHIGNTDDDTDACHLVGDSVVNQGDIEDFLGHSTQAFKRFYQKVYPVLNEGVEPVTISIYD